MRSTVSASLNFVTTPSGSLAALRHGASVMLVGDPSFARYARTMTGLDWQQGVGELVAQAGAYTLTVSRDVFGDAGTLTVTHGDRTAMTAQGDLVSVLRAAKAWEGDE